MFNFYNYFNFFLYNKKKLINIILNILNYKYYKLQLNKFLTFLVLLNSTKNNIKNSIEYFFGIKILKINTYIIKKKFKCKKKAFIYFNESISF
ncbi:hypothetical protein ASU29_140 [Candidatus Nasuia deltocephalinicola]|uniref:50S ribosomal protein L23 n=1 Tax=Candidatus Nasuia deltocephalincola TaxID=1160784 RepID=A0A0S2UPK3_9PROT|nr:hypothetical protein ASU29_140 [Candidatus Nasuia deltocephalinicola]